MISQKKIKTIGVWPLFPLIFSVFYFFPFLGWQPPMAVIVYSVLVYVAFVALFALAAYGERRASRMAMIAMVALLSSTAGINPGAGSLYGYVGFLIGFFFSLWPAISGFLVTMGIALVAGWLFAIEGPYYYWTTIVTSLGMFLVGTVVRRERRMVARERRSREQIEQLATVAERERIARDLHDILGHTLASISLKAQLTQKFAQADNTPAVLREAADIETITRSALSDLRATVSGYKAKTLTEIFSQLSAKLVDKGMAVDSAVDFSGLRSRVEAFLGLILTELVTNIMRHSDGDRACFETRRYDNAIELSVSDNGTTSNLEKGNGLRGIEERVEELGGSVWMDSTAGFRVVIRLDEVVA